MTSEWIGAGVHLNTIHNRLGRVHDLLARDAWGTIDMIELAAAIRICGAARNATNHAHDQW